jgi:hypothetical protein
VAAKPDKAAENVEKEAWKLFRDLGIQRGDLREYRNAEEFALDLMKQFARPTRWITSQSGSSVEEPQSA